MSDVMRQAYRKLSDEEANVMKMVKSFGADFHAFLESMGASRELSVAKTKIEEAVMWATKHVTAPPKGPPENGA